MLQWQCVLSKGLGWTLKGTGRNMLGTGRGEGISMLLRLLVRRQKGSADADSC